MHNNEIAVIYGKNPKEMVKRLLENINLGSGWKKEATIALKPNLVVSKKASSGATTSPEMVEGVIVYLQQQGFKNLTIMESSWIGDSTTKAFKVCGYEEISKKYQVPLLDLKKDATKTVKIKDLDLKVCASVYDVDVFINLPVLKGHCQTKMTCALKNMKGCIPDDEKRRYHTLGLHKPIAYLNKALKQDVVIVDGMMGDLNFEEGGTPVEMDRIIVGRDPVLIDSYIAELMGYNIEDIPYIPISAELGIGSTNLRDAVVTEYDIDNKNINTMKASSEVARLAKYIIDQDACSACYGTLIHALQRLKDKGKLDVLGEKIYIGQGYRGQASEGIGIGLCTSKFARSVGGCPPKAKDIVAFLEEE
ncbi:DUF362 domain-containing protein [Clostridium formicaceticum]|uniref:Iron-sulfur cluster-binding protein n=1 Tax=Clostridium formicaceticum TaxID=1497 RepID=A0AAC9RPG6_9CLOT|nr:DUF362 domain-containing protein [Clostridium formicaceticum]AOY74529.1 iron-sulfur cluster-binding protein [Clostridium formicaceticum]ARE88885.1 hypothetical protein CLFO_32910 [Clostridium formicaceticum]